jgi:DNA-binding NarL/FixJ family response regulator/tetratricopeptide (TPR) repeat protein
MAAILGSEFDFEMLRRASGLDEEALMAALESTVRAQIIAEVKSGRSGAGQFGFVHILIPTTLRESIMHVRRRRYHLQAAQAIEAVHPADYEALAYHCSEAGETERARIYYRLAGERARQAAPADAIRFYRTALGQWPEEDPVGRAEITAQLGHISYFIGDVPSALLCFEEAYVLFADLENRTQSGEMQRLIGCMHWERADRALSLEHYQKALAILEQGPETPELAWAISSISQMHMLSMEDELPIAWDQRAVVLVERLGADDVVAHALNNIGSSVACSGDFENGVRILGESLHRSLKSDLSMEACRAYYNMGCILQNHCLYSDARQKLDELYGYASKVYAKNSAYLAIFRLVWVDWLTGQWFSALRNRSLMSELSASLFSTGLYATWTKRIFAMIDLDLGRIEAGRSVLEESLPSALRANDIQTTVAHLGQLVRVYAAAGQEAKTVEMIDQMLALVSGMDRLSEDSIMPLLYACQQLAKITQLDPVEEKQRCLAQLELLAQKYDSGEAAAALAGAKGCLAAGADPSAAVENFRLAAEGWESIGRPYDQARALASQGDALAASGAGSTARGVWTQVLQLFDALVAQLDPESQSAFLDSPLVAAVVNAVRPSKGEAPDHKARQEQRLLTERELEVLALVAQGLTNAQIAEQLVLSPLTINAHLRSIFDKLNVTTRTAAVHNAMELGLV